MSRGFRLGDSLSGTLRDRAPHLFSKGGSGSGGSGGSSGGGGAEGGSEFNALGQEVAFAGERQNTSNSRLFEAHTQVENLDGWKNLDPDTQAGLIDSMTIQLQGRGNDTAFDRRANRDVSLLWSNTSQEAKENLARSTFSTDSRTNSPAQQRIMRDVQQIRDDQARARQRSRQSSPSNDQSFEEFFGL